MLLIIVDVANAANAHDDACLGVDAHGGDHAFGAALHRVGA
jgi:hypothetical protein